jgi:hypothetical protein
MGKITAYRYDSKEYADGEEIRSCSDHNDRLTATQKEAERAIRDGHDQGHDIRSKSLYAWKEQSVAERLWKHKRGHHLYEMEIDEADVRHIGDLDHFSSVETALRKKEDPEQHVKSYWAAAPTSQRIEILSSKAKVLRRLKHDNEHQSLHAQAVAKLRG